MIYLTNLIFGIFVLFISKILTRILPNINKRFNNIKDIVDKSINEEIVISENLKNAIILIEDRRYYSHLGVDLYAILRAFRNNTFRNRKEGASTITQQLIRILSNKRELSLKRKVNEIIIASLINNSFTKNEILSSYCETYIFKNCIGTNKLCEKETISIGKMSKYHAAQIAARFKYPILTRKNYLKYLKRVRTIEMKITANKTRRILTY